MSIGIGVVTRNRPALLARLLESFADLDLGPQVPENSTLHFIVVENDGLGTHEVQSVVQGFRARLAATPKWQAASVHVEIEPRLGIAHARNRVLDLADRLDLDFLAFTDDDCHVAPDWLAQLLKAQRQHGSHLTTNYTRYVADLDGCGILQRTLARGYLLKDEARIRNITDDMPAEAGTNNWMVAMDFVRAHALRFDTAVGFMMGEDKWFYMALQQAGGKVATAPAAQVEELLTADRLSVRWLFQRARASQIVTSQRKRPKRLRSIFSILAIFIRRFLLQLPWIPFDRGVSLVRCIETLGRITGRTDYMRGRTAEIYRHVPLLDAAPPMTAPPTP